MANTVNLATIAGVLPKTFVGDLISATRAASVVATLSPAEPMNFGTSNILTLGNRPRAEFVGESQQKSGTDIAFGSVAIEARKAQVTVRLSNEVDWANPQAAIDVVATIKKESSEALTEALDLGVLHKLNPLTGVQMTGWTNYVNATTNRVEIATAEADADVRTAVRALQAANKATNGIAMTSGFLASLGDLGNEATGLPRYPEIGFGTTIESFRGLNAAVSPTVRGFGADGVQLGAFDSKVEAIVGDFTNGIRWGVQKVVPAEVIPYGDPDGKGDLKRTNEFALRVEIVYGWYVFTDRFAVIENATA